jgi:hypothetical protein
MSEIKEGTYKIACTPEMLTKITEKHSFTFKYDGCECYCGYWDGRFMSACPEKVQVDRKASRSMRS